MAPLRSVGVQAVVMGQTKSFGRFCRSRDSQLAVPTACATHSGDWLLALPITACGLRLDDEAVRIAIVLRLGSELGSPHTCRCRSSVDARGTHDFVTHNPCVNMLPAEW